MIEKDKQILKRFASSVKNKFSDAKILGFGSRVIGNHSEDSDLDVCIVTETLNDKIDKEIMDIAWNIGFENDIVISTITYDKHTFEESPCRFSPLVKNIINNGLLI
ncbi:nucleotidyltransferase [Candidatus Magnetomorum sp. HK-1]|nr:nucleotidyltransferase [Candidatus Magnetomorum sp. HK-1]